MYNFPHLRYICISQFLFVITCYWNNLFSQLNAIKLNQGIFYSDCSVKSYLFLYNDENREAADLSETVASRDCVCFMGGMHEESKGCCRWGERSLMLAGKLGQYKHYNLI